MTGLVSRGSEQQDADVEKGHGINTNRSDLDGATLGPEPVPPESSESQIDAPPDTEKRVDTPQDEEVDPNIIDWDPDDPLNPKCWPDSKKWTNLVVISALAIITPLGSSMFAPGIPSIMEEFHETSSMLATFVLSIYILGFAFGPLVVAPLSEIYGRKPLYTIGSVLFVIFTVCVALSKNMPMLMAFRFLMGLAGSVPTTIGSGSIADTMHINTRARAMSIWALGPLLGPCIGPIMGGYLTEAAGWRWVFWLIAIVGGVFFPISQILLKETYSPVLLERKVEKLRKETGNPNLRSKLDLGTPKEKLKMAIVRPLKLLCLTPVVTLLSFYVGVSYGMLYLLITTFNFVYKEHYGFGEGTIGLAYIPPGIGMMTGVLSFGALSDRMVKKNDAKGLQHVPEIRLTPYLVLPYCCLVPVGLFIYGWTSDKHVQYIVPMLGVLIFAFGLIGVMSGIQNYLLDCYPKYAASVSAAIAVLRSLAGALLPLGGLDMYNALGLGWGNSLLGFVAIALIPLIVIFYIHGASLRKRFTPSL